MRDDDWEWVVEPIARFERVWLWEDRIEVVKAWWMYFDDNRTLQPDVRPLAGVRVTVQDEMINSNRLFPRYNVWMTISGPGFEWAVSSHRDPRIAHDFAAVVNSAASALARPATTGHDLVSKLAKLAELHAAGMLTDWEFAEAKARLLREDGGGGESALV
jgi:Short C-terminal domain